MQICRHDVDFIRQKMGFFGKFVLAGTWLVTNSGTVPGQSQSRGFCRIYLSREPDKSDQKVGAGTSLIIYHYTFVKIYIIADY